LWYTSEHCKIADHGLRQAEKGQTKALSALCALLREYSPTWYTEKYYKRAELALKNARKKNSSQKLGKQRVI
jgi:hypothetical protein